MKKVIILKGLPAFGKSDWAKEILDKYPNTYKRINKDDLRAMLDNSRWSSDAEKFILKVRDQLILMALENGKHVIVDDTNLHPKHENRIKELVKGKAEVEVKFFDVPVEECIKRDLQRLRSVGPKVIMDMYNQFLKQPVSKKEWENDLPYAIICDIDGTLALHNGRSPFDWERVYEDGPNVPVIKTVQTFKNFYTETEIILVSGRDEICKTLTEKWLNDYDIPYNRLYMRPQGNNEKDCIIKERIYREHIEDKYNVMFVLDDRNQTVNLWRSLGLTCFQVAEGDF